MIRRLLEDRDIFTPAENGGPAAFRSAEFDSGNAPLAPPRGLADHVPGELLVQFRPGSAAAAHAKALAAVGGRVVEDLGHGPLRIAIGHGLSVEQAMAILSKNPNVSFAEPNWIVSVAAVSNDPSFTNGQLWGMAGDASTPANAFGSQAAEAWTAGYTGSSKTVIGVIDSGIDYTHPDLYLNIWLNQGEIPTALRSGLTDIDGDGLIGFRDLNAAANAAQVSDLNGNGRIDAGDLLADARWENGADNDGNGYVDDLIGWDFVNNDNDPYDDNNHGTHVAGTIAGLGGNGVGVAGVTWSTQVIALKFLSATGSGATSNAVKAVDYFTSASTRAAGADFVATNNSWGGGGYSTAVYDSIVRGGRQDILFVAAAGNGGSDGRGDNNDSLANYPSNYNTTSALGFDAVIGVASITSSGALSGFSNYGATTVEIGAPGSGIVSTLPGGGYGSFSGTSMATPHVAGALALYASLRNGTAAELRADLLATSLYTASLDGRTLTDGRLDVMSLVQKALGGGTTPPPPPPPTVTNIYGTTASDTILGTTGDDKIWGVPADGTSLGKGTVDRVTGNGGNDLFVLGDARGRFYDDGSKRSAGSSDYAYITDFGPGDRIQLKGTASEYLFGAANVGGVNGVAIYHDSNRNGVLGSTDEVIGFVANVGQLSASNFLFV